MAAAGIAVAFSATERSKALERVRVTLGISVWEKAGITGTGAIVGDLSGLPSLVSPISPVGSHRLLAGSNPIAIAFEDDGVPRRTFSRLLFHDHQTATAGAMVANGNSSFEPRGIAPNAQLIVGWFAIDRNLLSGGFDFSGPFFSAGGSNEQDGILWTLFAMADQDVADLLAIPGNGYEYPPYQVATVINASIGAEGVESKRGEDKSARIFNAVATMTGVTLVCPTGNAGDEDDASDSDNPQLDDLNTIFSPASAHNVIAVGAIQRDFNSRLDTSGKGPMQARNYAEVAALYPMDTMNPVMPPFGGEDDDESVGGIFREVRSGVDIVAPGDQLNLPGLVYGSGLSTSTSSRLWIGTSFSSAIVAGAVGLMHELGEREGYSIHNVVTRAVLLNSANKEDDGVGVGFDNEQMETDVEDDPAKQFDLTTIGLDEEVGAGSLDLRRLFNQYHSGTVMTDLRPGDGLVGWARTATPDSLGGMDPTDSFRYDGTIVVSGTDPTVSMVTPGLEGRLSRSCMASFGGGVRIDDQNDPFDPWGNSNLEWTVAQRFGPFSESVERLLDGEYSPTAPMGRRDDPDLGNDGRQGSIGDNNDGGNPIAPANDEEHEGAAGSGTRPFRAGWDHGMIGEGDIDIPIGLITPGSGISVTLTWNRHEVLDLNAFDFAVHNPNLINFPAAGGGDDGTASDPFELIEFEYEDLNLELWRIEQVGANKLIFASRGVWNNTECFFVEFEGGAFDSAADGPFGNAPANYFIRIVFEQTLWDYGGFSFCSGGDGSMPENSIPLAGYFDRTRAEVEYGLAWYIDFNIAGVDFLGLLDRETGAVNLGIPGILDNVDRMFITPVGDINSDLIVDANDAALMIQNFGSIDPTFDLNGDGIADALDLEMIALHVGDTAEVRKITRSEKKIERQRRKAYKKMVKERRKINKKASRKLKKLGR